MVGACLRNAASVGGWLLYRDGPVGVIACGERWPDGSLRPAVEDLIGAGAVVAVLARTRSCSPEAQAAGAAFEAAAGVLATVLEESASGRELRAQGLDDDIAWAAASGVSDAVPVLGDDGAYLSAGQSDGALLQRRPRHDELQRQAAPGDGPAVRRTRMAAAAGVERHLHVGREHGGQHGHAGGGRPAGAPDERGGAGQLGQAARVNEVRVVLLGDGARHDRREDLRTDQVHQTAGDEGGRQPERRAAPEGAHHPDCTAAPPGGPVPGGHRLPRMPAQGGHA